MCGGYIVPAETTWITSLLWFPMYTQSDSFPLYICLYNESYSPSLCILECNTLHQKKMKKEMVIWSTRLLCWTTSRWVETYLNDIPWLTFYAAYQVEKKCYLYWKIWMFENSMNWLKVKNICVMLKRKLLIDLGQAVYQFLQP